MTEEERQHVKGIIINKFRGDIELFKEGVKIIEDLCHVPVLGVVPYFTDIHIEEEDSVALSQRSKVKGQRTKVAPRSSLLPPPIPPLSEGEGLGVRLKKREQLLPFSIILSLVEMDYSLI